jgi:rubredoxin
VLFVPFVDKSPFYKHLLHIEDHMKTYQCVVCGFIYDESQGLPEEGIAAGTRWDDIPADWSCPDCGVAKADFDMVEI